MGRSGSGKSFLEKALIEQYPHLFHKAISSTTRAPRDGEIDGVNYHFVDEEIFDELDLIQTTLFDSHHYGTTLSEYQTDHKYTILVVTPNSAKDLARAAKALLPGAHVINVYFNIGANVLRKNMLARGDTAEMIKDRLTNDNLDEQFVGSKLEAHLVIEDGMLNETLPETFMEWVEDETTAFYTHARDILENRIYAGDIIAYPVRQGSSMWMNKALVVDIEYKMYSWSTPDILRAVLKVISMSYDFVQDKPIPRKTQITRWDNSMVLPIARDHTFEDKKLTALVKLRTEMLYGEHA